MSTLPEGWIHGCVADMADLVKTRASLGETPYLEIGDVIPKEWRFELKDKPAVAGAKSAKAEDIVISNVRPGRGVAVTLPEDMAVSGGFTVLRKKRADSWSFVQSVLKDMRFFSYLEGLCEGGTYPTCKSEDVLAYPIPIPPLAEQRKIAEILGSVDEATHATRRVIDQTRSLKRAMLAKFFILTDVSGEVLVSVPPTHQVYLLDDIAQRGSGHTPDRKKPEYWDGGIKWVSLADSHRLDQIYISQTEYEISPAGIAHSSATYHVKDTVIVSRDAGVGKSAILAEDNMAVSQHFLAWKCGEKILPKYLYYWLQNMKPIFERLAAGNAVKTIGLPFFKKLHVAIPSITLQHQHAELLFQIDQNLMMAVKNLEQLENLKKALLHKLLSGDIRVPVKATDHFRDVTKMVLTKGNV